MMLSPPCLSLLQTYGAVTDQPGMKSLRLRQGQPRIASGEPLEHEQSPSTPSKLGPNPANGAARRR